MALISGGAFFICEMSLEHIHLLALFTIVGRPCSVSCCDRAGAHHERSHIEPIVTIKAIDLSLQDSTDGPTVILEPMVEIFNQMGDFFVGVQLRLLAHRCSNGRSPVWVKGLNRSRGRVLRGLLERSLVSNRSVLS